MMIMIKIMREGFKSGRYGETSLLSDSSSYMHLNIVQFLRYKRHFPTT